MFTKSGNYGITAPTAPDALGTHKGLNEGLGLMFKVDASEVAAGDDCLELFGGLKNILNSYQNDFDQGALRDSGYVYGPLQPRSAYLGVKIGF